MKKLFTLITLFAMTMAANAQLHFVYNNENVANGATIESSKVHEEILIPGVLAVGARDLHEVVEVLGVPRVAHDTVTGTGADGRRERTRLQHLR